jgi:hypothetical protein
MNIFPNQLLKASKFEIWSKGKIIDSGIVNADLWVEHLYPEMDTEGFQITIRVKDDNKNRIYNYIEERFFLDVAINLNDRIAIAIIPQNSNIVNNSSYNFFVDAASYFTRDNFEFPQKIPYCCSLFFDEEFELVKVSYTNAINNTLIEFYN